MVLTLLGLQRGCQAAYMVVFHGYGTSQTSFFLVIETLSNSTSINYNRITDWSYKKGFCFNIGGARNYMSSKQLDLEVLNTIHDVETNSPERTRGSIS